MMHHERTRPHQPGRRGFRAAAMAPAIRVTLTLTVFAIVGLAAACSSSTATDDAANDAVDDGATTTAQAELGDSAEAETDGSDTEGDGEAADDEAADDEALETTEFEADLLEWMDGTSLTEEVYEARFDAGFRSAVSYDEIVRVVTPLGAAAPWTKTEQLPDADGWTRLVASGDSGAAQVQVDYVLNATGHVVGILIEPVALGGDAATSTSDDPVQIVAEAAGPNSGGLSVLLVRDGETQTITDGDADRTGRDIDADTSFHIGSISKTFVAVMVLQLVEEGSVDLDEVVGTYLPDDPVGGEATVRQLLSHRSGLASYTDQPDFLADLSADWSRSFTSEEVLGYVEDAPVGTVDQFSYSNTNYIVLGRLIEEIDGVGIEEALVARITDPIGLNATTFGSDERSAELAAGFTPSTNNGDPDAPYTALNTAAWAAGAMISDPADLAEFLTALFDGRLLSPSSLEAMTTNPDAGSDGYGLGLVISPVDETAVAYGHDGKINGYSSLALIEPISGDVLIVLSNDDAIDASSVGSLIAADW